MTDSDIFSLAKALHHINIAKDYFEVVKIEAHSSLKNMFNGYINKCNFILNDINSKLGDDTRLIFKEEMSDSLSFDHIHNQLIMLSNEQRGYIEQIVDEMVKGAVITIKIENKNEHRERQDNS